MPSFKVTTDSQYGIAVEADSEFMAIIKFLRMIHDGELDESDFKALESDEDDTEVHP